MDKAKQAWSIITDRRNVNLMFFLIISLGITWQTVDQISLNYDLEQESRTIEQEIELLRIQKDTQELQNEFFRTEYYQDLSARDRLGLIGDGESLVILEQSSLEQTTERISSSFQDDQATVEQAEQPTPLEEWVRFFSGDSLTR